MTDNLIFFGGEFEQDSSELPWVKDWYKSAKEPNIPSTVTTVFVGDKGLLLQTYLYKSFVFKREQVCKYLVEALHVWQQEGLPTSPLIIAVLGKNQIRYGINPDGIQTVWSFDDTRYIATPITTKRKPESKQRNPFLPPNNPTGRKQPKSNPVDPPDENAVGGAERGV